MNLNLAKESTTVGQLLDVGLPGYWGVFAERQVKCSSFNDQTIKETDRL